MEKEMKKLVCHGDSLTGAGELDRSSIWPARVETCLNLTVVNSGIGGDTTAGMLSRFYPAVIQHCPDFVLIIGGTNDLWWDLDLKLIRANIFTMTCQAEHHGIVPLVGLPPPMVIEKARRQEFAAPPGGYERCVDKLAALINVLARSAQENQVACLDFYHPFCDETGNAIGKYFLDDGLHPNAAGHRLIAEKTVELFNSRFQTSL